ncbi:hypothetical protein HNP86_001915 [Methanococcus maripaludis]|uniref:Uncharacterized protein n=1 Tax=Methanococcus maripaludis TaxID=39152 RepID=A0A7J9P150_METMI|nr:hypothetical protein [Methanococcus maripaludis]MBA2851756.1 hypothetical protein [Methanococcus maripaludis]
MPSVVVRAFSTTDFTFEDLIVLESESNLLNIGRSYYNRTEDTLYTKALDKYVPMMIKKETRNPILMLKDALTCNGDVTITDKNTLVIRNNLFNKEVLTENVLKDLMCYKFYKLEADGRKRYVKINYTVSVYDGDITCSL